MVLLNILAFQIWISSAVIITQISRKYPHFRGRIHRNAGGVSNYFIDMSTDNII